MTVEHRYGETTIPEAPERVVSLDVQWTDVLAALGAPPVGYIRDPNTEDGSFPWRGDHLEDATAMTATDTLPYEQIAALEPDLIVVSYFAQDRADYDRLSAIAPTIPSLNDREVDAWQEITRAAGKVLGDEAAANALIEDVDGQVAAVAEDLPGLDGKTFALVNYVPGNSFTVVSDPDDGSTVLFSQLGLEIVPSIVEAGEGTPGRVQLSLERSAMFDGDLLLLLTNGAEPESIVGYRDLRAVESGAVAVLDYANASGINTPTPLSIPYCLDFLRPALVAAAE